MDKTINALGLMSGTSMDGIDASLITSDGEKNINIVGNLYLKYDPELKSSLIRFCQKINSKNDLVANIEEYEKLERKVTVKHAEIASKLISTFNLNVRIVGFHGQTILHKPKENYTIQMGNAKLLSQLLDKDIIYKFRDNDLKNGGEGAPLTPIYHHFLKKKLNIETPVLFLNIGGISNYTFSYKEKIIAKDAGPGNCLMDNYIKKILNKDFDEDGKLASAGKVDNILINNIFEHEVYNSESKRSFDTKDFDINFVRGLNKEDALANLNFFTAKFIAENIKKNFKEKLTILISGGGRKNKTLVSNLKKLLDHEICELDQFNLDGDFIESQAYAFLGIRSFFKKNISFPSTTGVNKSVTGGEIILRLKKS